jgi:hypothetical protein
MISVIDFDGLSLFGGDTRFNRALGQSSEMSALYYPQVPRLPHHTPRQAHSRRAAHHATITAWNAAAPASMAAPASVPSLPHPATSACSTRA